MALRLAPHTAPNLTKNQHDRVRQATQINPEIAMLSVYVLTLLVVLLVIYLFYAVINPEKL
jgi:K+-transporting ATPase KdpF subunit